MSHHIYQTNGIVLDKKNFGEADQFISFYTAKLGGLKASANGVRYLKSKLRYNLDNLSYANFSFVRGKESWRIIDAKEISGLSLIKDNNKYSSLSRTAKLLSRLVQGEEKSGNLWRIIEEGVLFLDKNSFDKKSLVNFEIIMALRILDNLGYIGEAVELEIFYRGELSLGIIDEMDNFKKEAVIKIKNGIRESQL